MIRKYLILLILIVSMLYSMCVRAQEINKAYSHKDFSGKTLVDIPAKDLNGVIIGSCFAQQTPNTEVFPLGVAITFKHCNLDNVVIPIGCVVEPTSTNKRILIQNDNEDWVLDESLNPVEPLQKEKYIELGLSYDPKDIPKTKTEGNPIISKTEWERANAEVVKQ